MEVLDEELPLPLGNVRIESDEGADYVPLKEKGKGLCSVEFEIRKETAAIILGFYAKKSGSTTYRNPSLSRNLETKLADK